MRLLLLRHAEAEVFPGGGVGTDDSARALTAAGRRCIRKIGSRLRVLERRVDCIASSGFVRSEQSADGLAHVYRRAERLQLSALAPGGEPADLVDWLARQPSDSVVALIGHEPGLGRLAGLLVAGRASRALALKEGGACLVAFDAAPAPANGMIRWMLTPAQLQALKP